MPFPAKAVANEFLSVAQQEGRGISPLKLQKLIYFANGWHLALRNDPLVNERFEAWQYGPVLRDLYLEFKLYGSKPIQKPAIEANLEDRSIVITTPRLEDHANADPTKVQFAKDLIRKVW